MYQQLQAYPFSALGFGDDLLDGPFLLPDRAFGLLVSLRGRQGGEMPSPSEVRWGRALPRRAQRERVHVFLRLDGGMVYLGAGSAGRAGVLLEPPLDEDAWRDLVARAVAPPPPPAEEAISALSARSTTGDRLVALRRFAARWFGCDEDAPELALPGGIPATLGAVHGVLGGRPVCVQNRLVPAADLAVEDGRVVVHVENQGVVLWGARADLGDDPPVEVRSGDSVMAPWRPEAPSLSGFLLQVLVQEAVYGAPFSASSDHVDPPELARLHRRLPLFAPPPWASSGVRFFGGGGVVGFAWPEAAGYGVWIGARERQALEAVEDLVEDWPDVGF